MFVKRLRKAGTKYLRLTVVSLVVAAVVTAVVTAIGDPQRLSLLPERVGPAFVGVFLQTFVVLFVIGLVSRLLKQNSDKMKTVWSEQVGGPLVDRWNGLARRTRAIVVGILTALIAGGSTAVAAVVYTVPLSVVGAISLCGWPVGTYWALRRRPSTGTSSAAKSVAVQSRYAELRQLETRTMALLVGFVVGAVTGGGLWLLGVDVAPTAVIAGLVWLVATVIVYNRYETTLARRTELAMVETMTIDDEIELSIKNKGRETVGLTSATIRDTTHTHYRLRKDITLQPGRTATMRLPASFTYSPTTTERTLPLGYTLDRSQEAPIIFSETGSAFELQHGHINTDTKEWTDTDERYNPQSTAVANGATSQD